MEKKASKHETELLFLWSLGVSQMWCPADGLGYPLAILARCDGNCTPTTLEDTKFRKADLGPQWKHQNFREHLDNTVLSGGLIVNSMVDCHRIID